MAEEDEEEEANDAATQAAAVNSSLSRGGPSGELSGKVAPTADATTAKAGGAEGPGGGGDGKGDGEDAEDGENSEGAKKRLMRPTEATADPLLIREYCHQVITPEVSDATSALLVELQRLQERAHLKDAVKAAMRKRYVCGLREVQRALQRDKAKALIVAHNIEVIESENGPSTR